LGYNICSNDKPSSKELKKIPEKTFKDSISLTYKYCFQI